MRDPVSEANDLNYLLCANVFYTLSVPTKILHLIEMLHTLLSIKSVTVAYQKDLETNYTLPQSIMMLAEIQMTIKKSAVDALLMSEGI